MKPANPQHSAPAASGTVVPINCQPMTAPPSAPTNVDTKPCNDAPIPATEPTGSIAIAPKLETEILKQAIVTDCSATNVHNVSVPDAATSTCTKVTVMNSRRAVCEITRMPMRSTILEFRNAEAL